MKITNKMHYIDQFIIPSIRPKHVESTWNNKLIYIVHLVGYFHSFITMHGFMNVTNKNTSIIIRLSNTINLFIL
jgi:hypothetical protein